MPQAQRLVLNHRLDLDQGRRAAHLLQHLGLAASLQGALQHQVGDEVGDDAVLALGGDDHQALGARLGRLGGDEFDPRVSTTGSSSLGTVLVAGRKRVPKPAAGTMAVRPRDGHLGFLHRLTP